MRMQPGFLSDLGGQRRTGRETQLRPSSPSFGGKEETPRFEAEGKPRQVWRAAEDQLLGRGGGRGGRRRRRLRGGAGAKLVELQRGGGLWRWRPGIACFSEWPGNFGSVETFGPSINSRNEARPVASANRRARHSLGRLFQKSPPRNRTGERRGRRTAAATRGERAAEITWCTSDSEGKTTDVPKAKCKTSMDTAGEPRDTRLRRDRTHEVPPSLPPSLEAQRPTTVPLQRGLPRRES